MPLRFVTLPILPPAQGDLLHWWDFSDLSTLFQDTGGSTPVTISGQSIARIDDKGTAGDNLTQDTAGTRPTYNDVIHSIGVGDFDGGDAIGIPSLSGSQGPGAATYSMAIIYAHDDIAFDFYAVANGSNEWAPGGDADSSMSMAGSGGAGSVNPSGVGTVRAALKTIRAANTQETWFSQDVATVTSSNTSNPMNDEIGYTIGSNTITGGGLAILGQILEIMIWDSSDGTDIIAAYKTYTAAKYGIVWA